MMNISFIFLHLQANGIKLSTLTTLIIRKWIHDTYLNIYLIYSNQNNYVLNLNLAVYVMECLVLQLVEYSGCSIYSS